MASTQERELARRKRVRVADLLAKILTDEGERWLNWRWYSFLICKGPSQSTLIDSLKPYPNQQRIFACFAVRKMKGDDERDMHAMSLTLQEEKNLSHLKAHIVALYSLGETGKEGSVERMWLFVAELIGENRGKTIIGIYHTGYRIGGCLIVNRTGDAVLVK